MCGTVHPLDGFKEKHLALVDPLVSDLLLRAPVLACLEGLETFDALDVGPMLVDFHAMPPFDALQVLTIL
ncbi:hypothetical protein D3C87_2186940 [compost metagenome]